MSAKEPRERGDPLPSPAEVLTLLLRYPLLIAGTAAVCFLFTLWSVGHQQPSFRADTTLLLRKAERQRDGAAGPLHELADAPELASELALMTSRGPAERVVAAPRDARPPVPESPDALHHLGLTTQVEDEGNRPIAGFLRRLDGRAHANGSLYASSHALHSGAPRAVHVCFPAAGQVELSLPGGGAATRLAYLNGQQFDYEGLALTLETRGEVVGKRFLVTVHEEREAVRSVQERLRAAETEPGTGLINVSFEDSDPLRVAAVLNAVVQNYMRLHEEQAEERARAELAQVDGELARIQRELASAQDELTELQSSRPLSVDVSESAKHLTLQITTLGVELANKRVELSLVTEALEDLVQGRLDALAKVAEGITDKSTRSLIEHIAELQAQAQLQERSDAGAYRNLLQQRILSLGESAQDLRATLSHLEGALRGLRSEGGAGIGRLGGTGPGAVDSAPVMNILIDTIERLDVDRRRLLSEDYLPDHPDVLAIDRAIDGHRARLEELLVSRIEGVRAQVSDALAFQRETEVILEEHPMAERREIDAALGRFRELASANLSSLRSALAARVDFLDAEKRELESTLGALPESERLQQGPRMRVDASAERVAELLETRETLMMRIAFVRPPAEVIDPAYPPAKRAAPRLGFSLGLSGLFGLALGLTLAFLLHRLRGAVLTMEELEDTSGLPVLCTMPPIPTQGKQKAGLRELVHSLRDDPGGPLASAFRSLRTNLRPMLGRDARGLMLGLTSCQPGEGKSLTAIGSALAFAAAGERVLLVGGGRDGGGLTASRAGLAQVLSGATPLAEAVVAMKGGGPHLLNAGASPAVLADAMERPEARLLLEHLVTRYGLVIFDLPALAAGGEVLAMAHHLDHLLLVFQRRQSSRAALRKALARLDRAGAHLVGASFNLGRPSGPARAVLHGLRRVSHATRLQNRRAA